MTDIDEVTAAIRRAVAGTLELRVDEIEDSADLVDDYRADSLLQIELLTQIEKIFQIEVPQSEILQMRSVDAIAEILARLPSPVQFAVAAIQGRPGGDV